MGAWGYGLFQSDHDLDIVSELSHEAGLTRMEEEDQAAAKAMGKTEEEVDSIYYSINGNSCSAPALVRKHLDSGVLSKIVAQKEATLLSISTKDRELEWYLRDPCYVYVLLGACAMTLGCQLPQSYLVMLKKVYTEGGLMPDALNQMKKALFGPHGYVNGTPYNFGSKSLIETANSADCKPNKFGFIGLNVPSPGGLFNTGMGNSFTSVILKELREKHNYPNSCAGCGLGSVPGAFDPGSGGKSLLICSRCKDRRYCSVNCQKKHWKIHKKVCDAAQVPI